jgi:HD-like signal output (HDOD) protein
MSSSNILKKIASLVKDLPSLPAVAQEVLQLLSIPGTEPALLQESMQRDPALTLKVLRIANSAYYRRGREISTLADAIVLLGLKTVQCIVMSSAVQRVLDSAGDVSEKLWEHSFAVAVACREVASHNRESTERKEEVYLAGLFHDVAKGVIATHFSGIYNLPLSLEGETEDLGFTHTNLAQVLLTKWAIPAVITEAVSSHHLDPLPEGYAEVIVLGNWLTEECAPGVVPVPRKVPTELLEKYNLIEEEDIETIRASVKAVLADA